MPYRKRISAEERVRIARTCLAGKMSCSEAAKRIGVNEQTVSDWIRRYETEGSLEMMETNKQRVYSEELKQQAVLEYMGGEGSLREICKKHKIRDKRSQVRICV